MKWVYIFYNIKSGGNCALQFISSAIERITFTEPKCEVFVFDIASGDSGSKPGFLDLKSRLKEHDKHFRIIVVGGDGTLLWCLSELHEHGIDYEKITIGIVPHGTGNDFASAFGWSSIKPQNLFDKYLNSLKKIVRMFINAPIVKHDLWKIRISVDNDGYFSKISQVDRLEEMICNDGVSVKTLEFIMCNYFSIGVESKIGRGFDRYRGTSKFKNKCRYGIEAFKKLFVKRVEINKIVDYMEQKNGDNWEVLFTTENGTDKPKLKKASSLLLLNIPRFSCGLNPWITNKCGIEGAKNEFYDQSIGDGELEILTYGTIFSIALNFIIRSNRAKRVSQGPGPWRIKMKELSPTSRIYFQVDGEFRVAYKPTFIEVEHSTVVNVMHANVSGWDKFGVRGPSSERLSGKLNASPSVSSSSTPTKNQS